MENFKQLFAQILEMRPQDIHMNVRLKNFASWDSIAAVSFLAMADAEWGIRLTADQVRKAVTVEDLYKLVKRPRMSRS